MSLFTDWEFLEDKGFEGKGIIGTIGKSNRSVDGLEGWYKFIL